MIDLSIALAHIRAERWTDAHQLVQTDDSPLSAWLHGIVHTHEGDLENAEYWYDKANRNFGTRGTLHEELERFEAKLLSIDRPSSRA